MDPLQPAVSVLVPTYGRTRVLSECVQSFLQQEYNGLAEMIVLNDHPDQELALDSGVVGRPVIVINVQERIQDLGTKRNALVQTATHDLVTFWDDDDLYLPGALSALSRLYLLRRNQVPYRRAARLSHVWQLQSPAHPKRTRGMGAAVQTPELGESAELIIRDSGCLWNCIMERALVGMVGGFPAHDRLQDCALLNKLTLAGHVLADMNSPGMPQCIRRLSFTGYLHSVDSAWSGEADNDKSAEHMRESVADLVRKGEEATGELTIVPQWKHDYTAIASRCWMAEGLNRTLPLPGQKASS